MYHLVRSWHRWVGLTAVLFLAVIAVTGFLLATKDSLGWVKPPTHDGAPIHGLGEVISMKEAGEAAFALGIPELRTYADIERMDYRPEKNVFKIVSLRGYHEVQVCGKTGRVLNVAKRVDQLTEDIHDLTWFAEAAHTYWLPVVACLLFVLCLTGASVFLSPVLRRAKFRREHGGRSKL